MKTEKIDLTNKNDVIAALHVWNNQRPGFDWGNYCSMASYRGDYRPVLQQKHDNDAMLRYIDRAGSISAADIVAAVNSSFSGRLQITENGIDYCTGQYWPTEYRAALRAGLLSCLFAYFREDGANKFPAIKKAFSRNFGRRIAGLI